MDFYRKNTLNHERHERHEKIFFALSREKQFSCHERLYCSLALSLRYIIKFKSDEQKHLHEWNSVYLRPYNDCQVEREILLYDPSLPLLSFVVMIYCMWA